MLVSRLRLNRLRRCSTISLIAPPAGTIGYTFSDGETLTFSRYGPGSRTASSSARGISATLSTVRPLNPYAPASFSASGKQLKLHLAQAIVVEKRLPLAHHPEIAVVHDNDLDGQRVIGDGCQFGNRHLEAAIADNGKHELVGPRKLCADRGRQTKAHGAQSAGIDPQPRLVESDQLRGPHLVLAYVAGHNGLAAGEAVDFGHQVLRLDLCRRGLGDERMFVFPFANLLPPGLARGGILLASSGASSFSSAISFGSTRLTSPTMGISGMPVLADFRRIDINMDHLRVRRKRRETAR